MSVLSIFLLKCFFSCSINAESAHQPLAFCRRIIRAQVNTATFVSLEFIGLALFNCIVYLSLVLLLYYILYYGTGVVMCIEVCWIINAHRLVPLQRCMREIDEMNPLLYNKIFMQFKSHK